MLYSVVWAAFVIVCLMMIVIILIQRGRGGGLIESLAGADSLFGTKTSDFLVKTTTVLTVLFFAFSLSLAYLSKERGKSITSKIKIEQPLVNATATVNATETAPDAAATVDAVGAEEAAPVAVPEAPAPDVPAVPAVDAPVAP
jgi:preprotein translocase subunit SecG